MSLEPAAKQVFTSLLEDYNRTVHPDNFKLLTHNKGGHGSLAWYVDHLYRTLGAEAALGEINQIKERLGEIRKIEASERTKETRNMIRERVYGAYHQVLKEEVGRQKEEPPVSKKKALELAKNKGELDALLSKLQIDPSSCYASTNFATVLELFEGYCLPKISFSDGSNGYSFGAVDRSLLPMWYWDPNCS